jgi:hypothetical protein
MRTLSPRALAALAFERGEEFDPALTLPSATLTEDLALLAGARALMCELSPMERRRQRERARPSRARSRSAGFRPTGSRGHSGRAEAA